MLLLLFILGLSIGSFLGVLVDRLPREETVIKGRSACEFCRKELQWFDLIPVLSFISTKGKCRYCKRQLSIFYPVIELSTGILFVLAYISQIFNPQSLIINPLSLTTLAYHLIIVSGFIVIFFMDLKCGVILDKVLLSLAALTVLYLFMFNSQSLILNFFSGVLVFLFFLGLALGFKFIRGKDGMGGGDIKLAFVLGLVLGFPNIVACLYLAFLTGAIGGIILILWKKKSPKSTALPFGPFLISGALVCLFWGNLILPKLLLLLGI
jgi:prepilin signal peptidase PulO-like enzyme (type II secretory pathway)